MTRRSGMGQPKRLAAAVLAGWLLLIPATLANLAGRPLSSPAAHADGSALPGAGDVLAALRALRAQPGDYGADGNLPESDGLSPDMIDELTNPGGEVPAPDTGAGPLATVSPAQLGMPGVMLTAYLNAERAMAVAYPRCGLHWSVLAAIGRIESNHARGGAVDANGTTVQAILGPQLAGGPGVAAIRDTDGGKLDGDPVWDRAVGPMQFIPSTWARYAMDGNADGIASPHNIYDSTVAAGRYLCAGGGDLRDPLALAQAVFRYNHSESYVMNVLSWAAAYATGVTPLPASAPAAQPVPGQPVAALPTPEQPGASPAPSPTGSSSSTTASSSSSTATTTTTTTTTALTTTTPTCPTSTTDPTTTPTTPTSVPPGCETTTTPPPSSSETTTEPASTPSSSGMTPSGATSSGDTSSTPSLPAA